MLSDSDSPVVFCHNDILPANIIYDESEQEIKFIDYEYGCYNYQAFDIGNHFNEYAGIVDFDESYLPDKEHQIKWIREYLKFYRHFTENSNSTKIDECNVDKLYIQVNQFAACSHLLWGIWCLTQYQFSTHEFDYWQFGRQRLGLYFKYKEQFLKQ
ncbi:ethanolamine kinase 2-like protein [Leptotrombidium deliense]|uniref:ethanolamine kinase n=1 Tax=Leptotrombidium deliense TaxID=299467 RepID=A0A443SAA0_9ACAR|nr:ethanolamine kinase 2-like protein [Leptotrombidium deliense]